MSSLPRSRGLLFGASELPLKRYFARPGPGRIGLGAFVGIVALTALGACDGRLDERPTGVSALPMGDLTPSKSGPPEVRIEAPANGATVSGTVTISVRAKAGGAAVSRTDLFINSELVTSSTQERFTYSWNTAGLSGSQNIRATAVDVQGVTASASINVTVSGGGGGGGGGTGVLSVAVNPHIVTGGSPSTGTVGLTGTAPAGGTTVTLSSSHPQVASVPGGVTVPAGETITTFPVTTSAVAATTEVTISASAGGTTRTTTLTVTAPAGDGQLASLTINPSIVVGGQNSQGTVTLAAAVGGETQVTLSSSTPSVATVPPSVTVPAGATSASFTITTLPNQSGQGQFSEISGHAGGVTRSATITTTGVPQGPAITSVALFPSTVGGGGPATGIVTFNSPINDGVLFNFTISHPEIVTVLNFLQTGPAGPNASARIWSSNQRAFAVTTNPVASNTPVTITVAACCGAVGQASATLNLTTVAPPPPDVVRITSARWRPGGSGGTLEVRAESSSPTAILSVYMVRLPDRYLMHLVPIGGGRYQGEQTFGGGMTNPEDIEVRSNLGGSATSRVRD
jgi:hypothetical protein